MSKSIFKVQTISVYISTTMVLLLLGVMGLLFVTAGALSRHIKQDLTLSLIIDNETSEGEILKLKKTVEKKPYVQQCRYISRNEVLEEQKRELGTDPVEFLGYNPYEASIEVTLKNDYANNASISKIEKELLKRKEIKEITYQKELINTVNNNIRKISIVLIVFLAMLTIISWSLIGNLVRLSIYSKRFLMHTMKLVGATWGFIRKPFLRHNLKIGFLSSLLSNAILAGGLYLLWQEEPAIATIMPPEHIAIVAAATTLFGITICTLCAYLSVNKFLRMGSNDLYFI